ncbi:Gas vesicle protein [Thermomonospora echinospora]|uniref:Gas vesicle protein A n=1 Tax=Thermomonospora echinospora TaxID=1992 RepID=A0A1H6CIT6_9ACTN|nr:gas vesicle protein GvpJ [Thermomonospora echinospora]SEG72859.1 Gas vesicle protein [Thermomonospora echinospora]
MTVVQPPGGGRGGPGAGGLADVIDTILDKGLVIDAYVSVSLLGIQLLTINARVVVASVETYLQFAEATNRLDLSAQEKPGVGDLVGGLLPGGSAKSDEVSAADLQALQAADEEREPELVRAERDEAPEPRPRRRRADREE